MNGQISWREANKNEKFDKIKNRLLFSLFILIFLMAAGMGDILVKIEPNQTLEAQIDQAEAKTSAEGQILPKTVLVGIDPYVDGDQEPRYRFGTVGVASWYDYTLNGIEWSKDHDTCASRDHERYSTVRVTNLANGKSVDCYVNDYGPELGQTPERHIDLSSHAFRQIADLKLGLLEVRIEEIK